MSEHAQAAHRTVASISTTVNGMVRQGLLARMQDDVDGRVVYLRLTDKGTRLLAEARAARRELGEWALDMGGDALLPARQALRERYDRLSPRVGAPATGSRVAGATLGSVSAAP